MGFATTRWDSGAEGTTNICPQDRETEFSPDVFILSLVTRKFHVGVMLFVLLVHEHKLQLPIEFVR